MIGLEKSGKQFGLRELSFVGMALLIALLGLELLFRLFNIGLGPVDPRKLDIKHNVGDFIGFLEQDLNMHGKEGGVSFYMEDPALMWKLRPGFKGRARDFFTASLTDEAPEWSFNINREGFRGPDFEIKRESGVYRIVTLGDSCTFGFGVDEGDAYPYRLQAELERRCPSCRFEVINLGVPGYTSEQGRALAAQWLAKLNPQAVTIAYGTNDWWKRDVSDEREMARLSGSKARLGRIFRMSALVRGIEALVSHGGEPPAPGSAAEMGPRVSLPRYHDNILQIADIARNAGARVILVDNNFYVPYGTKPLGEIASERPDYTLVDSVGVLAGRLQDLDTLRKQFPISTDLAIRQYLKVISDRSMFLLMVDPVHPNALGHQFIAEALADSIMNNSSIAESIAERERYTRTLPKIGTAGGGFLQRTALEMRAAAWGEEILPQRP